ncbi:HEAT repeat domain-containing protein [Pedobacter frigiditerrae]|uniref:HEAT repeat domain-containing protein n=1 Tax=Pedobacter frigiditerrae TaxID=2530452 RepID=UPI00292D3B49|nr:HEAT repeat domain-containing protein [Pedobacter frigiditerrae]
MAKKELTNDELLQLTNDLKNSASGKRRSAAKKIGKNEIIQLGDELYNAYLKEREDKRTWETQTEMILALGKIGYQKALPELKHIIDKNEPHDMVTIASARSYVRLKRKDLNDAQPVIELLKTGNFSVISGATSILTFDDMKPSISEIETIISIFDGKKEEEIAIKGYGDIREYLISAMSKWDKKLCAEYLNQFINADNAKLKAIAEDALKGKKSRYE